MPGTPSAGSSGHLLYRMRASDYLRLPGSKNIWRVGGFGLSTSPGTKSTLRTFEEVREARNEDSQVASAVSAKFTMTKSAAANRRVCSTLPSPEPMRRADASSSG